MMADRGAYFNQVEGSQSEAGPSSPPLLHLPPILLAIAFTGQRLLDAALLARLQVKGVSFDFLDDVFLQDFPLEAAKRVFQRLLPPAGKEEGFAG